MNILFLGASKRVSLLEKFFDASERIGEKLKIFSCEIADDFYPISHLAEILVGPSFRDEKFQSWLRDVINEKQIDIVIPNMDSATVALSRFKATNDESSALLAVSAYELCSTFDDKKAAEKLFIGLKFPIPGNTPGKFPKIVKPRFGYGGKGILLFQNELDIEVFSKQNKMDDYIVQDYIPGVETTVDFYVGKVGLVGYVLRDRIEVSDGEVMCCVTRSPSIEEKKLIEQIAEIPKWYGCVTVQYIRDKFGNPYLIEINPRFGGGATCAIEAGLDMPLYLMSEKRNIKFTKPEKIKNIKMTRARRDFFKQI